MKKMIDAEELIHRMTHAAHAIIEASLLPCDGSEMSDERLTDATVMGLSLNEAVLLVEDMEDESHGE